MSTTIQTNGYKLIKSLHLFLIVGAFLIGLGVNIGLTLSKFSEQEKDVQMLNEGRKRNAENIESLWKTQTNTSRKIDEIGYNLQALMERQGMKYKKLD